MKIETITMMTSHLEEMKFFYTETMGFSLLGQGKDNFRIATGSTEIEFKEGYNNPYYHFAFDIPDNQFEEAKNWVKERVPLLIEDGEDEAFFEHFPARAFYFEDPAGNIVEFIARPTVTENREHSFTVESIYYVSEMSLVVEDPKEAHDVLSQLGVPERDRKEPNPAGLTFMGEREDGSFLLLTPPGRRWYFSDKVSAVFPLEVKLNEGQHVQVDEDQALRVLKGI
jgi:catechol 2,3-dioxygenase-like lactoylglutathione lyase family enzyme